MSDITKRLHALARAEHDDLSVGDEAADEIEALKMHVERLQSTLSEYANKSNEDFNAGMKAAAQRCAEIAESFSYSGTIPQAIRKEFGELEE